MSEDCMSLGDNKDLKRGDKVQIKAHHSKKGKGLSYPSFEGMLLDDAGTSEGWDVVDLMNIKGEEISVYCFSIER